MKFATRAILALSIAMAYGQRLSAQRPQLAQEAFKNIQSLRGIPVDQFMGFHQHLANRVRAHVFLCMLA